MDEHARTPREDEAVVDVVHEEAALARENDQVLVLASLTRPARPASLVTVKPWSAAGAKASAGA